MTWNSFLSVVGFCFAACALTVAVLTAQALRRWQARYLALDSAVDSLRREMELVASISARTGRRVQRVEHEYSDVADRVDMVESRTPEPSGTAPLNQAIEWARRGANPDQLVEKFGLSSGEADLVARMHGRPRSA